MPQIRINAWGRTWDLNLGRPVDLSLPLQRSLIKTHPRAFDIPPHVIAPLKMGDWEGSLHKGSSVNVDHLQITAHGAGTHTECLGHIAGYAWTIDRVPLPGLIPGLLCTVPDRQNISLAVLKNALELCRSASGVSPDTPSGAALIVRRNGVSTEALRGMNYSGNSAPVFEPEALQWVAELGFEHLLTDLPSVDPERDEGRLLAHRAWWGLPMKGSLLNWKPDETHARDQRALRSTITEFVAVPSKVRDGVLFLQISVLPLESDASPSRPMAFVPVS